MSEGNVAPGPIGSSLAVMMVKIFVAFIVLLAVAGWLRAWSHGLLP